MRVLDNLENYDIPSGFTYSGNKDTLFPTSFARIDPFF